MTDMDGDPIRPDPHSDDWYDGYGACQREHAAQPVAGEFDVVDMPDGYKSIVAAQPAAGEGRPDDELMQRLAIEGGATSELCGRAYIRIRLLENLLAEARAALQPASEGTPEKA